MKCHVAKVPYFVCTISPIVFCKSLYLSINNHLYLIFTIVIPLFILKDTVEIGYTGAWGCQNMSHVNCINLLLESYPKPPQNVQTFISDMCYEPKWFRNTCVISGKRKERSLVMCFLYSNQTNSHFHIRMKWYNGSAEKGATKHVSFHEVNLHGIYLNIRFLIYRTTIILTKFLSYKYLIVYS